MEEKLIYAIYQNSKDASDAIDVILKKTESESLLKDLTLQQDKYLKIKNIARDRIIEKRKSLPRESVFQRFEFYASVSLFLKNTTDEKNAKTLMNGCCEGISEIRTLLKSGKEREEFATELALDLLMLEEESMDILKSYL